MVDKKAFSEKIRFYRNKSGMTQTELAGRLHVSFQAVSSWECGNTLPDLDNLCELAALLGVSTDELLREKSSADTPVYIGIDGGGSSTEFALFTAEGHILTCFKLSGSNASNVGVPGALSVFYRGIDGCLAKNAAVRGIFMGCAGGHLDEVLKNLTEKYRDIPIYIDSDGVNALLSADGDAAMISGTGTVFLRHEPNGGYRKFAGWGHAWGDYGSAYNLGKEAVCAALAYEEDIESSPLLYALVKEKLGAQNVRAATRGWCDVSGIAKLAPVVFEAYRQNDPYAEAILRHEMKNLARIAAGVCPNGGRIIACGGINQHFGDITLPILGEYVPKNIEFVLPTLPPVYGACREACRRFGVSCGEDFFSTFLADYRQQMP